MAKGCSRAQQYVLAGLNHANGVPGLHPLMSGARRPAMYPPVAMRRAGEALFLAILVAALPTVVSLCELRCTAFPVAASRAVAPACAGHAARQQERVPGTVPSDEHQGCARHVVLLATGSGTGTGIPINPAKVAMLRPLGSFFVAPEKRLELGKLAFSDLSPPFGRSSDILRL